jgi:hypothetical protein
MNPSFFLSQKKQYFPMTVGQLTVDVSLSAEFWYFTAGLDLSTLFPETLRTLHMRHIFSMPSPLIPHTGNVPGASFTV